MDSPDLQGARVGVVIPAYRAEKHIENVVRGIPPYVRSIIVVDDKSPDDTAQVLAGIDDPRLKVIHHELNQGVGGAMRTGFAEALRLGLDIVVKVDADEQMDPVYLPQLLAPLVQGRADMTKGNRYSSVSSVRAMPLIRIAGNAGLTFLVKLSSGYWNIFDPANGYVALRTSVLERIELETLPLRYFFESGLLIELGKLRAVIQDVPMEARYGDEQSSLSVTRTLIGFPPRLLYGLLRRLFWRYFVHDFTALSVFVLLGFPALLGGAAYAFVVWREVVGTGVAATAGQVMMAAMPIILGVQMLLQAIVLDIQAVPRQPLSPPLERRG